MRTRLLSGLAAACLLLTACSGGSEESEASTPLVVDGDVVVDVTATFALAPGDVQTPEQLDRSCAAATELVDVHSPILLDAGSLTPDELRAQVAGLGALAMDVHEYAPFEQQDEVTALTRLVVLLDERLSQYDYDWAALEAADGSFIELLRREGIDTALSGLIAWVLVNCPEGTIKTPG